MPLGPTVVQYFVNANYFSGHTFTQDYATATLQEAKDLATQIAAGYYDKYLAYMWQGARIARPRDALGRFLPGWVMTVVYKAPGAGDVSGVPGFVDPDLLLEGLPWDVPPAGM